MEHVNRIVRLDPAINSGDCGEHPFNPSYLYLQRYVFTRPAFSSKAYNKYSWLMNNKAVTPRYRKSSICHCTRTNHRNNILPYSRRCRRYPRMYNNIHRRHSGCCKSRLVKSCNNPRNMAHNNCRHSPGIHRFRTKLWLLESSSLQKLLPSSTSW